MFPYVASQVEKTNMGSTGPTVLESDTVLAQRALQDILMPRGKN